MLNENVHAPSVNAREGISMESSFETMARLVDSLPPPGWSGTLSLHSATEEGLPGQDRQAHNSSARQFPDTATL